MTDDEVVTMTRQALRESMGALAPEEIYVRSGYDYDDVPVLFIDAFLAPNTPLLSGEVSNGALWAVRSALVKRAELRFPHLSLRHPDDIYPEGNVTLDNLRKAPASA